MEIKYRVYKDRVIEMHTKGLSPIQMETEIPVMCDTIKKWHARLGLTINKAKRGTSSTVIDKDKFIKLYNKGLTDLEIGNQLKLSRRYICKLRQEYGLVKNSESGRTLAKEEIRLEQFAESVLIGSLLGDGYLCRKEASNASGTQAHSIKQIEYLRHLHKIFAPIASKNISFGRNKSTGVEHEYARFNFLHNPYLNQFYDNLYNESGKKIISQFILDRYNEVSLAYHFMDDGSKAKNGYIIATYGFDLACVRAFVNHLRTRFNLKVTIRKDKTVYIKKESIKTFNALVADKIIPSLSYKLH